MLIAQQRPKNFQRLPTERQRFASLPRLFEPHGFFEHFASAIELGFLIDGEFRRVSDRFGRREYQRANANRYHEPANEITQREHGIPP
jgi:hypothetical protein